MKADRLVSKRFAELADKANLLVSEESVDIDKFHEWAISVLSLLQRTFGEKSLHCKKFAENYEYAEDGDDRASIEICKGIFRAAREDYDGGYLFDVRSLIKAEVTDDALDQATELLDAGLKDPACVLTGVALEMCLKEICGRENISLGKLDKMNTNLCKAGVYNIAKQK